MRARFIAPVLLGLSAAVLSACGDDTSDSAASGAAESVTVTDSRGETEVPLNPDSVVVFDMGVLDTLDTLGVDAVTGVPQGGSIPDYLSQYAGDDVTNVGDLFEPDLEAIPATEPDLIIVGGRSSEAYDTLVKAFPDVAVLDVSVDQRNYLDSVEENTEMLASIFGKESEAEQILDDLEQRIDAVEDKAEGAGDALVLLTSGGEVTAYSTGSRFGFVHDEFRIEPATGELGDAESRHGEAVSFEFVRETNPDHLFVVDRDSAIGESGASAKEILDNELVRSTSAWKNENVTYVDATAWYIVVGGLTALDTVIGEVESALK